MFKFIDVLCETAEALSGCFHFREEIKKDGLSNTVLTAFNYFYDQEDADSQAIKKDLSRGILNRCTVSLRNRGIWQDGSSLATRDKFLTFFDRVGDACESFTRGLDSMEISNEATFIGNVQKSIRYREQTLEALTLLEKSIQSLINEKFFKGSDLASSKTLFTLESFIKRTLKDISYHVEYCKTALLSIEGKNLLKNQGTIGAKVHTGDFYKMFYFLCKSIYEDFQKIDDELFRSWRHLY